MFDFRSRVPTADELTAFFADEALRESLFTAAREVRTAVYGNAVYLRGLIETTNICKNNCYYCGIRKDNKTIERYHLTHDEILECCAEGYKLGYRTFVLQGGELGADNSEQRTGNNGKNAERFQRNNANTDETHPLSSVHCSLSSDDKFLLPLVREIRVTYPDCAITLSFGERSAASYRALKGAGADRYLLRHETANEAHYRTLHPPEMSWKNRINCLHTLKKLGYAVGCGFMVGSPGQTVDCLVEDLAFIADFKPDMVGIGPFLPHSATPFANKPKGSLTRTLVLIAVLRLMCPDLLLPATTALGTLHPTGREQGILAGANVVMPNLSPVSVRKKYLLYDDKICTGEEAAECKGCLARRMESIGYRIVSERGDRKQITTNR